MQELSTLLKSILDRPACGQPVNGKFHIKHAAESVFGPTSSPSDKLFKSLRQSWPHIMDKIDCSDLCRFDLNGLSGSVLEQEASLFLEWVQLILVWLGGVDEVPGFKFQWPGAYHHARFLAKSLYLLKLDMLSS